GNGSGGPTKVAARGGKSSGIKSYSPRNGRARRSILTNPPRIPTTSRARAGLYNDARTWSRSLALLGLLAGAEATGSEFGVKSVPQAGQWMLEPDGFSATSQEPAHLGHSTV